MQSSGVHGSGGFGAGVALGFHLLAGFVWIFVLGGLAAAAVGEPGALAWGGSAFVLWISAAARMRHEPAGDAWSTSLQWWVASLVAPIALGLLALRRLSWKADLTTGGGAGDTAAGEASVAERVDALEREVAQLRQDLETLAATAVAAAPRSAAAPSAPPAEPPRVDAPRPA